MAQPSSHPGHYQDRVVHIGSHFGVMRQHLVKMWGGCNEWPRGERMGYVARRLFVLPLSPPICDGGRVDGGRRWSLPSRWTVLPCVHRRPRLVMTSSPLGGPAFRAARRCVLRRAPPGFCAVRSLRRRHSASLPVVAPIRAAACAPRPLVSCVWSTPTSGGPVVMLSFRCVLGFSLILRFRILGYR